MQEEAAETVAALVNGDDERGMTRSKAAGALVISPFSPVWVRCAQI